MIKSILTISLLAFSGIAMSAPPKGTKAVKQTQSEVKVLATCNGIFMTPCPEATIDKKTKKKTIVWPDTENNSWHENAGMFDKVPTIADIESIFPHTHFNDVSAYCPVIWRLTEEGDETVLHCYFRMPADVVTNMWLVSNECVILDKETGTIYQSYRSVPDAYGKVFSVKGKEGSVLDFQVFFPKLAESTKEICIYGVPNWYMRGMDISLYQEQQHFFNRKVLNYDEAPKFHKPHLVSPAKDYNKDNHLSWAIYEDPHLIKPVKDGTLAIWLTRDATYLAEACEMNWRREYFGRGGNNLLMDQSGHQYKLKEILDYPNGPIFWMEGSAGDYFTIVQVFEPIPLYSESVTYIVPESEPFAMWGANWEGKVLNLDIQKLRDNQKLFEYHNRVIVTDSRQATK